MKPKKDEIAYSETMPGEYGNWHWSVRGDFHNGFLGITQTKDGGDLSRCILSPAQVKALVKFYRECGSKI